MQEFLDHSNHSTIYTLFFHAQLTIMNVNHKFDVLQTKARFDAYRRSSQADRQVLVKHKKL